MIFWPDNESVAIWWATNLALVFIEDKYEQIVVIRNETVKVAPMLTQ